MIYFWRASKKKLHVKATINDENQNFDALVIKLLNSAYVHVNEKQRRNFSLVLKIFAFKKRTWQCLVGIWEAFIEVLEVTTEMALECWH